MSKLSAYKTKRSFKKTPEPKPQVKKSSQKSLIFVIQKHAARSLHYDLRLELDGVLLSWALPKGLPKDVDEKHLAIMTEDHPYEYKDFHGVIPKGNYGAGLVEIWDEGTYQTKDAIDKNDIESYMRVAIKKGHIHFHLKGKRIDSDYALIKFKTANTKNSWLIFKVADEKKVPKLKNDPWPKDVKPMLAQLVEEPFNDKDWLFEIKWDGYRALAKIRKGKVNLVSRNEKSFDFPSIASKLQKNIHEDAILDGEIVVLNEQGKVDFTLIQNSKKIKPEDIFYYVFDLLYLGNEDTRKWPLIDRKERLEVLLAPLKNTNVRYSDHVLEKGVRFFKEVKKLGLEGMMAKKIDSTYVGKRSSKWLKIKTSVLEQAVIGGFSKSSDGRPFGALVLGRMTPQGFEYIGKVGTGFSVASMRAIMAKLKPLVRKTCPFRRFPKLAGVTFVKPEIVCLVSFTEWTNQGFMRHPVFKELIDKKSKK